MGGRDPVPPTDDRGQYDTARDLLQAGQYARVAEILQQARVASERRGDQIAAHVLAIACRLCLAGSQCQVEVAWYRQAYTDADRQERELRQKLYQIVDLAAQIEIPRAPAAMAALLGGDLALDVQPGDGDLDRPGWWERLRSFVGRHLPWGGGRRRRSQAPPALDLFSPPPVLAPPLDRTAAIRRPESRQESQLPVPHPQAAGAPASPAPPEPVSSHAAPPAPPPGAPPRPESESIPAPAPQQAHAFAVFCLGPFRLYHNNQPVAEWSSLKARAIFKYLVTHRDTPTVKDVLMDLFWPDADPASARRSLHQAIYTLRQTLRQGQSDFRHVQFQDDCYLLNPELDIWIDSQAFVQCVQQGRRLQDRGQVREAMVELGTAEMIYQGDFMQEDLYEDWPAAQRTRLRALYLDTIDRLSAYHVAQGQHTTAIALCQRALALDRCCEAVHRRLIQCYVARGQRYLAVRQYQACVQALRDELDLSPSDETETLYRTLIDGQT